MASLNMVDYVRASSVSPLFYHILRFHINENTLEIYPTEAEFSRGMRSLIQSFVQVVNDSPRIVLASRLRLFVRKFCITSEARDFGSGSMSVRQILYGRSDFTTNVARIGRLVGRAILQLKAVIPTLESHFELVKPLPEKILDSFEVAEIDKLPSLDIYEKREFWGLSSFLFKSTGRSDILFSTQKEFGFGKWNTSRHRTLRSPFKYLPFFLIGGRWPRTFDIFQRACSARCDRYSAKC